MTTTLVAIPTAGHRLSTLAQLLSHLALQPNTDSAGFDVLVLVNAPAVPEDVRALCLKHGAAVRHVPRPGLANVRNAALDAASDYTFIAFIDDDEVPTDEWPASLVIAALEQHADIALGPLTGHIDSPDDGWLPDSRLIRPDQHHPAGSFGGDIYSSNTLIRMATVHSSNVRFDATFNRSGGEDTDFFRRLTAAGARAIWVPEAGVIETIDASRLSFAWYWNRRMNEGAVYWMVEAGPNARRTRRSNLVHSVGRVGRGIGRLARGTVANDPVQRAQGLGDVAASLGEGRAWLGWRPGGYAPRSINE